MKMEYLIKVTVGLILVNFVLDRALKFNQKEIDSINPFITNRDFKSF